MPNDIKFFIGHRVESHPMLEIVWEGNKKHAFGSQGSLIREHEESTVAQAPSDSEDPCFYVGTVNPGKPGRYVCGPCHSHYLTMPATSVRPTGRSVPQPQLSHTFPDPRTIRQTVNAAQRKSTVNPPPVIAFGRGIHPPSMTHSTGPDITIPSSWGQPGRSSGSGYSVNHAQYGTEHGQPSRSSGSGYLVNHVQYGTERERWSKLSYALPPMETITLDISAVHEVGARRKGHWVVIGNIQEGKKDVDARIDAPGLMDIAFDTILPNILTFGAGFPWRIEEFVVRDAVWVDLFTHKASVPYFISQCMVPSKKGSKAPTFKTKQFALMVVVPEAQWNEYEEWVEKAEEVRQVTTRQVQVQHRVETTENVSTVLQSTSASTQNLTSSSAFESTKWSHRNNLSTATTSSSPPHKKLAVAPPKALFSLPDRSDLKEALWSGGSATNFDVAQVLGTYTENIHFYGIPTRPLADILSKNLNYRSFKVELVQAIIGQLTVNSSMCSMLGAGGFKTAHPGWLSLTPLVKSGLGSVPGQNVAVKRPFHKVFPSASSLMYKIGCFSSIDKIAKLGKEANVLYWAHSLLQLTYAFIDHCIASSEEPPPFNIPRVRFVDAGLAISYSQRDSKPTKAGSKTGSSCVGYLVEELIEGGPDVFVKFIHNMDSNPLLDQDDYGYEVALFFSFTQHVQSVGQGKDLFGKGNMECTVSMFEKQHKCNEFCEWPGFGLVPFATTTEDESTEETGAGEVRCREDGPIAS
ncbi:uncharacterized protein HD556DRAFT_1313689 [Suillus plorans]|uniref:Alpha-type protein kinase domain-containing protein n=1 Tax=Suillus plorans TaxID=116603 RepID=A0A9P7DBW1_9AGAM|nr:uncharacterized protein HD556DRAFT_1313689 [Suillus plorans]KAG1786134.1 hypothetical protein HD556DRAFT_1313689 [Suillus plorans]